MQSGPEYKFVFDVNDVKFRQGVERLAAAFVHIANACAAAIVALQEAEQAEWWKRGESEPEYCHRPEKPEWEIDDQEFPPPSMSA